MICVNCVPLLSYVCIFLATVVYGQNLLQTSVLTGSMVTAPNYVTSSLFVMMFNNKLVFKLKNKNIIIK